MAQRRSPKEVEEISRAVMAELREAGDLLGALAEYRDLERRLLHEFGTETRVDIRRFAAQLRTELADQKARTGALPLPMTTFLGRRKECERAMQALREHAHVQLVGPAGVGKSRIGLRVAWRAERESHAAVTYLSLEGLRDEDFESYLAAAFGIENGAVVSPIEGVLGKLAQRESFLMLDGCEAVAEPVRRFVVAALARSPGVSILTTSRRRLEAPGAVIDIAPLTIPGGDALNAGTETAVDFFVDRACAAMPSFTLNDRTLALITTICRRLDGLPLALELAASRLGVMSLDQLHRRLVNRFALLRSESDGVKRSLSDTIRFSYELLDARQQRCFTQLGVFRDGFSLEAAERVCAADDLSEERVLQTLSTLRDDSLLVSNDVGGTIRFRLLETLWEFARTELHARPDEEYRTALKHVQSCVAFVTERRDAIAILDAQTCAQVDLEFANVRAALDWCVTTSGAARSGLEILTALRRYLMVRGLSATMLPIASTLLDMVPSAERLELWYASALRLTGTLANICEHPRAAEFHELAVARFRTLGDTLALAQGLMSLGAAAYRKADYHRAETLFKEALPLYTEREDRGGIFFAHKNLGSLLSALGRVDEARTHYELANSLGEASSWFDYENLVNNRANLAYIMGDYQIGVGYAREALGLCREHGYGLVEALDLVAVNTFGLGDRPGAWTVFREAFGLARTCESPQAIAQLIEDAVWCGAQAGHDPARLGEALGFANGLREHHRNPVNPSFALHMQSTLALIRERLGESALAVALARGSAMDRAEIFTLLNDLSKANYAPSVLPGLTERESEIAYLVADGKRSSEIARALFVSVRTVDNHLSAVYRKLQVKSRAQVVAFVLAMDPGRRRPQGPN